MNAFIQDCDRRTELAKKRLAETQEELSAEVSSKAEKVHELAEMIGKKLAQAEQAGAEGKVEESMKFMEEVEEVRKKKVSAELEYRNSMPASSYQQQKLRVCEVCSAYLGIHDNDRRLADHFGGKLHLGFIKIRERLEELLVSKSVTFHFHEFCTNEIFCTFCRKLMRIVNLNGEMLESVMACHPQTLVNLDTLAKVAVVLEMPLGIGKTAKNADADPDHGQEIGIEIEIVTEDVARVRDLAHETGIDVADISGLGPETETGTEIVADRDHVLGSGGDVAVQDPGPGTDTIGNAVVDHPKFNNVNSAIPTSEFFISNVPKDSK